MPKTAEQNKQIRQATQTIIVESAMICFAQNGYAHTTIRDIARQANISTGLMYHYFESKEALLEAVLENCMAILSGVLLGAYKQGQPGERIPGLLWAMFAMLEEDQEFWALFQMLRSQPAIMTVLGDAFRQWTRQLRNLFTVELRNAGRPEPEIDALILYSLIEGTIQQYLLDPTDYPLSTIADRIVAEYQP